MPDMIAVNSIESLLLPEEVSKDLEMIAEEKEAPPQKKTQTVTNEEDEASEKEDASKKTGASDKGTDSQQSAARETADAGKKHDASKKGDIGEADPEKLALLLGVITEKISILKRAEKKNAVRVGRSMDREERSLKEEKARLEAVEARLNSLDVKAGASTTATSAVTFVDTSHKKTSWETYENEKETIEELVLKIWPPGKGHHILVVLEDISQSPNPNRARHTIGVHGKKPQELLYLTREEGHGKRKNAIDELVTALEKKKRTPSSYVRPAVRKATKLVAI